MPIQHYMRILYISRCRGPLMSGALWTRLTCQTYVAIAKPWEESPMAAIARALRGDNDGMELRTVMS